MRSDTVICSDRKSSSSARDPLQADCNNCKGLCCILLPFDADQGFAFAKAAGIPCPNLTPTFKCGIHAALAHHGFPGCSLYDCHGAGQYVTALLELGDQWYECEARVNEVYGVFATAKALHGRLKRQRVASAAPG